MDVKEREREKVGVTVCAVNDVVRDVVVNANVRKEKTAVRNDLRNHIKQKEIHLKAIRRVPAKGFSYTRRDRRERRVAIASTTLIVLVHF